MSSLLVNATPNPPGLTSPADGTVFTSTVSPTLKISRVSNGFWYWFQWSEDSTFTTHDDYTISSSYSALTVNSLKFNTKYYWRVFTIGYNFADTSVASEVRCFTTCSTVNITSPANNTTLTNSVKPLLYWDQVTGATNTQLEWDTAATFDSPLRDDYTVTNTGTSLYVNRLKFGTKYYWHARAINAADTSMWSNTFCFTTSSTVTLANPYDGATNQILRPVLEVTTMTGAGHYIYEWDTTMLFNSPLHGSMSSTSKSSTVNPSLKMGAHYYWRARATNSDDSDTSAWSASRSFTTSGGTPTLTSPTNNSTGWHINPTLDWNTVTSCSYYDYECDTTPMFNSPAKKEGSVASGTTEAQISNLFFGTKYYWRVRTRMNTDTSLWSAVWNFTTTDGCPTHSSPSNNVTGQSILPTIEWNPVSGSDYYDYQCDTTLAFNSTELQEGTIAAGMSEVTLDTLRFGTKYYWRVRSRFVTDTSNWSNAWNFTTAGKLTLTAPANGKTNVGSSVKLDWIYIAGGTIYEYQYDTVATFDSPVLVGGTVSVDTSEATITGLMLNSTYYWRVRELSSVDTTVWSDVWHFSTSRTSYTSEFYQSACDSFAWYGQWYHQSGDYVRVFQAADRGDSTVTMHLTINHSVATEFSVTTEGSYVWAGQTLTQSGDYTFTFTSMAGCDSTVTLHLTIMTPSELDDVNGELKVDVYPNPSTGIIYLNGYNGEIWIYDLDGKMVMSAEGESIDITSLPAGNYILRIAGGRTFKVFKQ